MVSYSAGRIFAHQRKTYLDNHPFVLHRVLGNLPSMSPISQEHAFTRRARMAELETRVLWKQIHTPHDAADPAMLQRGLRRGRPWSLRCKICVLGLLRKTRKSRMIRLGKS